MESIADAVIGKVSFDSSGIIGEWEDGWEFDKVELLQRVTVGQEEFSKLWVVSLVKCCPSGKDPGGMFAGIIAKRFPIADVLMQYNFNEEAELEAVPTMMSSVDAHASKTGSRRYQSFFVVEM